MVRNERGFTLMEILLAVFIIGLFAGGAAFATKSIRQNARIKKAKQDLKILASAVDQFEMDNGVFPKNIEELVHDPGDLSDYQPGGYLKGGKIPLDPWKHEYVFIGEGAPEGFAFDIISYGADGAEGGEGVNKDIRYSDLE